MKKLHACLIVCCVLFLMVFAGAGIQETGAQTGDQKDLILATTTSTVDTGLLDALVPLFEKKTGFRVKTVSAGTGQALAMGEKGEADVLLVHAPEAEQKLVDAGVAINYQLVMHNDFILVGPAADPAGAKGKPSADALKAIAAKEALFVSRGDDSGTHKKELSLWKRADVTPKGAKWYQESGQGMGATLLMASEKQGYTLTDRGTYLAQKANVKLEIISEGDQALLNIYHVMQVNPEKFSKVNAAGAKAFVEFMVAPETQKVIGEFGKEKYGSPLFFPDAGKKM
jgi:tungstate transport system substrate-binding protein